MKTQFIHQAAIYFVLIVSSILISNSISGQIVDNDEPCFAIPMACGDTLEQSFSSATVSVPDDCGGSGLGDVWFTFTTDGSQLYTIGVAYDYDYEFSGVSQLYSGNDCTNLTELTDCNYGQYHINEAGTYYYRIRPASSSYINDIALVFLSCVDYDCPDLSAMIGDACDDGNQQTTFDTLNGDCECIGLPDPTNDEPCTATAIACGDTVLQTFAGATQSVVDDCGGNLLGDVWFSFTTDGSELYTIGQSDDDFMAVIQLYEGDDCENLTEMTECVYFDDYFEVTEAGTWYLRMRPRLTDDIASVYLTCEEYDCIELETFFGAPCNDDNPNTSHDTITDNCECVGVPDATNDEACTATIITCGDSLLQSFVGATASFEDDCSNLSTNPSIKDVWYNFTITDSQPYTVGATGIEYEGDGITIQLFEGDNCDNMTEIEPCGDNFELGDFEINAPGNYYFRLRPTTEYAADEIATVFLNCDGDVGIPEIDEAAFSIYPNPAKDQITLETALSANRIPKIATLYSSYGVQVSHYQIVKASRQVLTLPNNLSPGVYFLNIIENGRMISKRIVVLP